MCSFDQIMYFVYALCVIAVIYATVSTVKIEK